MALEVGDRVRFEHRGLGSDGIILAVASTENGEDWFVVESDHRPPPMLVKEVLLFRDSALTLLHQTVRYDVVADCLDHLHRVVADDWAAYNTLETPKETYLARLHARLSEFRKAVEAEAAYPTEDQS